MHYFLILDDLIFRPKLRGRRKLVRAPESAFSGLQPENITGASGSDGHVSVSAITGSVASLARMLSIVTHARLRAKIEGREFRQSFEMAKALTWKDLSEVQILQILQTQTTSEGRRKLQQALQLEDKDKVDDLKAEILLDLHFSTFLYQTAIPFAREQRFSIEKISALVSIVKDVHQQSTEDRFTVAKSWEYAENLLLMHTVQRPPFSTALFSLVELQTITQYLLHTYYKHYKLYAYAFTPTYILNVETMKVDLHELAPVIPILRSAETEDEREAHMARLQKELEEIDRKLKESEQIAREAAIAASIEAAYRATIPTEVTQAASDAVVKHLEQMRTDIEEKLLLTETMILGKLKGLPTSRDSSPDKTRKEASPEKGKEGKAKVKEGKNEGKEGKEGKKSKSKK